MGLQGYLLCFVLTAAIELAVYRFALRRKGHYLDLCLINLVTNPAANALIIALGRGMKAVLGVEVLVVLAEWAMLRGIHVRRPLFVSIVLNVSSWLSGVLLQFLPWDIFG